MTYPQFKYNWLGHGCDYDRAHGFQCWDLAVQYVSDRGKTPGWGYDAIDWWDKYDYDNWQSINLRAALEKVEKPVQGDIVVIRTRTKYGHIAILDDIDEKTGQMIVLQQDGFDQGLKTHMAVWNINQVAGYLRVRE